MLPNVVDFRQAISAEDNEEITREGNTDFCSADFSRLSGFPV
jgi:hypothetical protein